VKFASQFSKLREAAVRAAPSSRSRDKQERSESLRDLLRWLLLVPLILLLLFGCASLGMIGLSPASADTRSYLNADYAPWDFEVIQPIREEIIEEILTDQELYADLFDEPVIPTINPAPFWNTFSNISTPGVSSPSMRSFSIL